MTIPRNKLIEFPNIGKTPFGSPTSTVIIGYPLGLVRTFKYVAVDPETGLYQIADKNGKPIPVTSPPNFPDDYSNLINTQTQLYGGLQNNISWKGFQIDFLLQFVRKIGPRQLYYDNGSGLTPGSFHWSASNQPAILTKRWQKPGDNATFARYNTDGSVIIWPPYTDAGYSYDTSYIRLKNVSFSWELPSRWLAKAHINRVQLYLRGQNIATITKFSGIDPESPSINSLPPLKIWTLGGLVEL